MSNITKQRLAAQQLGSEAGHPSADTLAAFVERGLRPSERQLVLSHLAVCPACRQTMSFAASVEQTSPAVLTSRRLGLRFPTVLRWASAAAALAVAIGVGVFSYEHQNRPAFTAAYPSDVQEKAVAPAAQPTVEQTPEVANAHRKAEAGMKAEHSGRASSESRIMADASARVAEPQFKKRQHGAVLGGLVGGSLPRTVPAPNTLDGFTASNAVAPAPPAPAPAPADAKASTFSDITAAPRVAAANAPATPDQLARESRSNAQKDIGGTAGRVDTSAFPGGATLQQRPASSLEMKAVASSAIGGPVRTGGARGFTPIAHWTISSEGKLQRQSGDGRVTSIEPAPGVSMRAVAAQGIEVWAAGAQPNLAAKQWQQRPVLFHSSDAGESWSKIDGPWQSQINALNLAGTNALTVITPDGSWTTLDAGKSWTRK